MSASDVNAAKQPLQLSNQCWKDSAIFRLNVEFDTQRIFFFCAVILQYCVY